jgi:hypothetical protein
VTFYDLMFTFQQYVSAECRFDRWFLFALVPSSQNRSRRPSPSSTYPHVSVAATITMLSARHRVDRSLITGAYASSAELQFLSMFLTNSGTFLDCLMSRSKSEVQRCYGYAFGLNGCTVVSMRRDGDSADVKILFYCPHTP